MARRKATGRKKCEGKAYWGAVKVKQGEARGSKKSLVDRCVRSCRSPRATCEKLVSSGLKGRRKAKGPGKRWKRRSTTAQRAVRKAFAAKSRSCKRKSSTRRGFLSCMRGKLATPAKGRRRR